MKKFSRPEWAVYRVGHEGNLIQTTCKIVWYGIIQLDPSGEVSSSSCGVSGGFVTTGAY